MKSIRVSVDENLHRKLKIVCVQRGVSMKEAVITAIKMLLDLWQAQDMVLSGDLALGGELQEQVEQADG